LNSPCPSAEVVVTALPAAPKYDEGGCRRIETNAADVSVQRGGGSENLSFNFGAKHRQNIVDKLTLLA